MKLVLIIYMIHFLGVEVLVLAVFVPLREDGVNEAHKAEQAEAHRSLILVVMRTIVDG